MIGENRCGMLRRHEEVMSRSLEIARRFKKERQTRGDCRFLISEMCAQGFCHAGAQGRAARRHQRRVKSILVERMYETITKRERPVRKLFFAYWPDEVVYAIESFKALLRFFRINLERFGNDRRIELVALNAGRHEQAKIFLI